MADSAADGTRANIRDGYTALATHALALDGKWAAPAPGYDGWTCKDLLAHLSSTAASLPAVAGSVVAVASSAGPSVPFDSDRWNASQLRRRADKETQELMLELESGTDRLVAQLAELPLDQPITIGPYAGLSLGHAMREMLEHQRHHLADLERALAG
jgi:uncharacterized protein (TIGR03083 family)